jgi:ABC-2 type transport system ATP-binding protein
MIDVRDLSKRYGDKLAVDHLTFSVRPGMVTGFLGPNGAGKSTTMRMILGLDRPTTGSATVNGKPYSEHRAPLREVGAILEARAIHTGRSAYNHLLALGQTHGIPRSRVDEVIALVGLQDVARKRVGAFSLGMGQRLGIAAALLGDPKTLILDEPSNGLDPEGIRWIRTLLRSLAAEGRTILVSSHLMSEMSMMADWLIVVGRGRLIADSTVEGFVQLAAGDAVRVRTPDPARLRSTAEALDGVTVSSDESGDGRALLLQGITCEAVGELAAANRIVLHELAPEQASLEEAFMRLTMDSVEYHAAPATREPTAGAAR